MKKYIYLILFIIVLISAYWFFSKLFPKESGIWNEGEKIENQDLKRTGWNKGFWTTVDFPLEQRICIETNNSDVKIKKTTRTSLYEIKGDVDDLLAQFNQEEIEKRLENEKPYILSHMDKATYRYQKSIFFKGEKQKYLIPTNNIYSILFPGVNIPSSSEDLDLIYSDIVIGFPEGVLVSYKEGVFVISENEKSLIRSPEIFESLGYDWGGVLEANEYEAKIQGTHSHPIEFFFPHPSGTIIKKGDQLFYVWERGLYQLDENERIKYFKYQPVITIEEEKLQTECNGNECCINYDPRNNPPSYFNFSNTLIWNISPTNQVKWEITRKINKENLIYRLKGLKYKFTFLFS